MNYYIGIDSGGTFMKAALFDAQGNQHGLAKQSASVINEKQGWVERDLNALWNDAVVTIKELLNVTAVNPIDIKGLGISAQGKGVYLLDKKGHGLGRGITSSDSRSLSIVKAWMNDGLPNIVHQKTLQTLWTGHPVSIVRWLKDNEPNTYANIGSIMMAHDYLRYRFTDVITAEITNMSESNFFNAHTGTYDLELLRLFGVEEVWNALPKIINPDDISGYITEDVARETGLAVGTPVFGGLFDVVSTALCSGISSDETSLNYVMGTWAVTSGITKSITQEKHNFVYGHHAITDEYIVHEASPTSAGNYEWFSSYLGENGCFNHKDNEALVSSLEVASSSVFFVPFLYGSNQGLGLKSGFYGLQAHHTKGHLIQAIWEGILFSHNFHLERMRIRFPNAKVLRVTGGPVSCHTWMQMLADLTGMMTEVLNVNETGALGAAIIAMVGSHEYDTISSCIQNIQSHSVQYKPNPDNFIKFQNKYMKYQKLVQIFKEFEES
jgi:L-xylulokinase